MSKLRVDQEFRQIGVAAVFGQPSDIVEILLGGVGADIDVLQFLIVDVGDQLREVVETVIDDPEGAAGKGGIAAAPMLRRDFQLQHRGAVFRRRQRGAGRGIAGADDDDVMLGNIHGKMPPTQHCAEGISERVGSAPCVLRDARCAGSSG